MQEKNFLTLLLKSIPGHSTENLFCICHIVLQSHLVRKHYGIRSACVEKVIPKNKSDEAIIFHNNKASCLCSSSFPLVPVALFGGRVGR